MRKINSQWLIIMGKFYAVAVGKQVGIFSTWAVAENQVKGYKGAIYKSFSTREEAENFLANHTNKKSESGSKDAPLTLAPVGKTLIYTDGSYADGLMGFGVVIRTSDKAEINAYGCISLEKKSNQVAELYAIYVALSLISGDILLYTDSMYAVTCLTAYIHDWVKNGWKNVSNLELMQGIYGLMKKDGNGNNRDVEILHVPAHAGYELNEKADRLAEKGRTQKEALITEKLE